MSRLKGGTLSIDVGGSGIKGMVLDPNGTPLNERVRLTTPRPALPAAVLDTIGQVAQAQPDFDRVSIGFPGVVRLARCIPRPTWTGTGPVYPWRRRLSAAPAGPAGPPMMPMYKVTV